jgi:LysM repeat protein
MRKISLWLVVFVLSAGSVHAQDTATQQQLDKLSGQIQDLLEAQAKQGKQIDDLNKQISELSDKVNTPAANPDTATEEELKKVAAEVQQVDQKRLDDRALILKEIDKLGSVGSTSSHKSSTTTKAAPDDTATSAAAGPAVPQKGYDYEVKAGDTVKAIAKAYREQGVKVTSTQILQANPGLDANKLYVGKKIFIPDPTAK